MFANRRTLTAGPRKTTIMSGKIEVNQVRKDNKTSPIITWATQRLKIKRPKRLRRALVTHSAIGG
jgi:hypothetical protein